MVGGGSPKVGASATSVSPPSRRRSPTPPGAPNAIFGHLLRPIIMVLGLLVLVDLHDL